LILTYLTSIWRPRWGDPLKFCLDFNYGKLESIGVALFAWSCV